MERITETQFAVAIVTMVTVNLGQETNKKRKSEINIALMGLRLRKYIELREN